ERPVLMPLRVRVVLGCPEEGGPHHGLTAAARPEHRDVLFLLPGPRHDRRLRHMLVQGAGLGACTKKALPLGPGRASLAACAGTSARSTTSSPEPPRRRRMTPRSGSRPRGPPDATMHRPRGVLAGLAT